MAGTPVLPQLSSNTYRCGVAGSDTGDGWNITANLTGDVYDTPGRFAGPVGAAIGPIACGTYNFDISQFSAANGNRVRLAVGGHVGYDFKAFSAQAHGARDVVTGAQYTNALGRTRDNHSIDGAIRFIVPLCTPPAPLVTPRVRKG